MVVRDTPVARDTATCRPRPIAHGLGRYEHSPHPLVHYSTQHLVATPNPSFVNHPSSIHYLHWLLRDDGDEDQCQLDCVATALIHERPIGYASPSHAEQSPW